MEYLYSSMRLHDNPFTLFRLKGTQLVCSLLCIIFLASCGNGKSGKNTEDAARDTATAGKANTTGEEDTIEDLLEMYDGQERKEKLATADKIFDLLNREETTDDRITVTGRTPADSVDMLV